MKKKYLILISIIIVYFLVLFLFIGKDKIKSSKREVTIVLDHDTVFKLKGTSWKNASSEIEKKDLDWTEFNVFVNHENLGKYYLWYDEKWYLFDKDKKPYNYEIGSFLAIQSNDEIKVLNFTPSTPEDMTYIKQALKENNITWVEDFSVNNLYQIDFDNDGTIENFYAISNAFLENAPSNQVFSIVFMEKNGQINYLYKSIDENNGQNSCKPYLNTVIDLTGDNTYEIILSCGYFSIEPRHDMLFTYQNHEFNLVLSNQ